MKKQFWSLFFTFCLFTVPISAQNIAPTSIEQSILNEINLARKNPKLYLGYLEEFRKLFKGKTVHYPNGVMMDTIEGTVAVDDAINFMKMVPKLDPYKFSTGLAQPANLQLKDLMENNNLGHFGKNGSQLPKRISLFGLLPLNYAENIVYYVDLPREIVLTMIIDDGIPGRGHRKNLFSRALKVVGIAYGKGKENEGLCVSVFADLFREAKPAKLASEQRKGAKSRTLSP